MIRILLCASLLAPSAGTAQQVDCSTAEIVAKGLAALSKTFTEMAQWCIDGDIRQPACLKLGELNEQHQLAANQAASSVALSLMARQCPDE